MSRKDPLEQQDWARRYRDAVELQLGERVEAVGPFERQRGLYEGKGAWEAPFGKLIHEIFSVKDEKGRLDELPESFLLAVTSDKVYALSYKQTRKKLEVKDKVADFDRKSTSVYKEEGGDWADVVLELIEDGRSSRIKVNRNALNAEKNPWGAEVVAALSK
jgi:hypothetical protein